MPTLKQIIDHFAEKCWGCQQVKVRSEEPFPHEDGDWVWCSFRGPRGLGRHSVLWDLRGGITLRRNAPINCAFKPTPDYLDYLARIQRDKVRWSNQAIGSGYKPRFETHVPLKKEKILL